MSCVGLTDRVLQDTGWSDWGEEGTKGTGVSFPQTPRGKVKHECRRGLRYSFGDREAPDRGDYQTRGRRVSSDPSMAFSWMT